MPVEKNYQLTLEECLEAAGCKLAPRRTISPGLILLGLGSLACWLLLLWAGIDKFKLPTVYSLIVLSFAFCLAGTACWKWEGRNSVRSQDAVLRRRFAEWMKPKTLRIDDDGWSLISEGSEDRRTFGSLRELIENTKTLVLVTDAPYVLPKRIFEPNELEEMRSLGSRKGTGITHSIRASLSPWDFVVASFEYYRWRHQPFLILFSLLPPLIFGAVVINERFWPQNEIVVMHSEIPFTILAITIWYLAFPAFEISRAYSKYRNVVLDSLDEDGLVLKTADSIFRIRWGRPFIGRDSWKCFLIEVDRGYFLIPKRILTAEKLAIVRAKLAEDTSD